MTTVIVEQFQQIELRVGTIAEAAPHPRADRLLVLRVKLNGEERQLVAGIRAHYEPADLVGKQIVVVTNLAPATLRGVESQGMLLAATDPAGALALISPIGRSPLVPRFADMPIVGAGAPAVTFRLTAGGNYAESS